MARDLTALEAGSKLDMVMGYEHNSWPREVGAGPIREGLSRADRSRTRKKSPVQPWTRLVKEKQIFEQFSIAGSNSPDRTRGNIYTFSCLSAIEKRSHIW